MASDSNTRKSEQSKGMSAKNKKITHLRVVGVISRLNVPVARNGGRNGIAKVGRAGAVLARLLAVGVERVVLSGDERHDG